jgi:hypothetical protein
MANELGLKFSTTAKLEGLLHQINALLLSDFPHVASEDALKTLDIYFKENRGRLQQAAQSGNSQILQSTCATINQRIEQVLPLLGLLLRSTNIRNSFEAYFSLDALAKELIGPAAKIVLSSEWDFSPMTYPMNMAMLPDFVLLGMPASESANSLLLPLAGHELGHSVWLQRDLENKFAPKVQMTTEHLLLSNWEEYQRTFPEQRTLPAKPETLTTMFVSNHLATIQAHARSQIEEIFCDAIGAFTFGEAFACAFHFLLAPNLGGTRSSHEYPTLKDRATYIKEFASLDMEALGFTNYAGAFFEEDDVLNQQYAFLISIADKAAQELAASMYTEAKQIVIATAKVEALNKDNIETIASTFRQGLPVDGDYSLPDILNAAWKHAFDQTKIGSLDVKALLAWISELVLKSIEVREFRKRTNA